MSQSSSDSHSPSPYVEGVADRHVQGVVECDHEEDSDHQVEGHHGEEGSDHQVEGHHGEDHQVEGHHGEDPRLLHFSTADLYLRYVRALSLIRFERYGACADDLVRAAQLGAIEVP